MTEFPVQALIPFGVISAAIIGGFFSLLSLIISKEQKISEFRQQWIDSLRKELSDHVAAVVSLSVMRENQTDSDEEFTGKTNELQQRVTSTFTSIKLRINPDDRDNEIKQLNAQVLELVDNGRSLFNDKKWKEARINCNKVTDAAIPMLKAEWDRVKRGEKVYVWSKRMAVLVLVFSFFAASWASISFWPSLNKSALIQKSNIKLSVFGEKNHEVSTENPKR